MKTDNNNSKLVLLPYSSGANRIKSTPTVVVATEGPHHVSVVCLGRSNNDDSWENVDCADNLVLNNPAPLINNNRPNVQRRARNSNRGRRRILNKATPDPFNYSAFQGLTAEAVVGTTDANGQVLHLVKWEGRDELQFVPALFTTIKFPHVVLAFYENRFKLAYNCNKEDDDEDHHMDVSLTTSSV